ncbi:hypothetical protein F4776DRAFT_618516 [Hypoxylon sp. NC0597]|nr:hypothetical protein F4776DRAFT_618516 [Hypoxylon sp. NC0597]
MSRRYNQRTSVHDTRQYHALSVLDESEEDDDICVWKDGSSQSDLYGPGEDQTSVYHYDINSDWGELLREGITTTATTTWHDGAHDVENNNTGQGNLTYETVEAQAQAQEEEVAKALLTTRRNLTRILQSTLKLECRAGKVVKEGIRQTLDATVANMNMLEGDSDLTPLEEMNEIKALSEIAWQRLYLVDRHWRRQSRHARDAQGRSPNVQIKSEPDVKSWLKHEMGINHLAGEDTCYFTVGDLANGRRFQDWAIYLTELCQFKDNPNDESKLVNLAWRFLDRDLRGRRPVDSARIEDFILELEEKHRSGTFNELLKDPQKQEKDDKEAWKMIKKYWSLKIN